MKSAFLSNITQFTGHPNQVHTSPLCNVSGQNESLKNICWGLFPELRMFDLVCELNLTFKEPLWSRHFLSNITQFTGHPNQVHTSPLCNVSGQNESLKNIRWGLYPELRMFDLVCELKAYFNYLVDCGLIMELQPFFINPMQCWHHHQWVNGSHV